MQKAIPVIGVPLAPISPESLEKTVAPENNQTIQPADNSINSNRGLLVSSWERSLSETQKLAYDEMKKRFQKDPENKIKYKSMKSLKKALFKVRFDYLEQLGLEIIPLAPISDEERERIKAENKKKKMEKKLANQKLVKTAKKSAPKQKKSKKKVAQTSKVPIRSLMEVNVQPIHSHPDPHPVIFFPDPPTEKRGYNWRNYTGEVQFQPVVDYTRQEEYGSINPLTGYQATQNEWMNHSWPQTQGQANSSNFADFQTSSTMSSAATSLSTVSSYPSQIPSYSSQFPPPNSSPFVTSDYSPAPSAAPALTGSSGVFHQPVEPQFAMTAMIQAARGYHPQTYQEPLSIPSPQPLSSPLDSKIKKKEKIDSLLDTSVLKSAEPSQYAQYFSKVSAQSAPIGTPADDEEEAMRRRLLDIEQQLEEIERQKQESVLAEELRRREMELQQREQWMAMREQELYMREVMTNAQKRKSRSRSRSRDRDRDRRSSHRHDYDAPSSSSSSHRRQHSPSDRRRPSTYSTRDSREIKIERRDRLREARDAEAARRDGQRSDHRKRFGAAPTRGEGSSYSDNRSGRIQEAQSYRHSSRRRAQSPKTEFISDEE